MDVGTCFDEPTPGAPEPPAPITPSLCPSELVAGMNTLDNGREFILALPEALDEDEVTPVIFLWAWLAGDAMDFYEQGDVQTAVDHYRFIAVIPEPKGDLPFQWPYELIRPQARIDEEIAFFDEMLACVDQAFAVHRGCVSSVGVSAGALWTQVLAGGRGAYLASFLSLSGGSGGVIKDWQGSPKKMPAMVLWGGPTDNCFGLMNFHQTSQTLGAELTEDGHVVLECIHNCGHAAPPFEIPGAPTTFAPLWEFTFDHPYWLPAGLSPYTGGIPATMPEWCAVGMGSSTPRTGECTGEPGC